jgi:YidC/Oxa1 family membrane protein insertase
MDFQRLILFVALTFTFMMMWEAWQKDYGPKPPQQISSTASIQGKSSGAVPAQDVPGSPLSSGGVDAPASVVQKIDSAGRIHVETDAFRIEIDKLGGDIRTVELIKFPLEINKPKISFRMMDDQKDLFIAQSGLISTSAHDVPNHHKVFTSAQDSYKIAVDSDELAVTLTWKGKDGLTVEKVYTFKRDNYLINVDFVVSNNSKADWQGHSYYQLQRVRPNEEGQSSFIYTYTGGVIFTQEEKYEKINFDDMKEKNLNRTSIGGWAAMIQHYFLSAWVPNQEEENSFYTKSPGDDRFIIGSVSAVKTVAAGAQNNLTSQLFVGPKLQKELEAAAEGLNLTVDYGVLHFIAKPLYWLLDNIHGIVNNWGWSIIILTILIKAIFYKLSETSYKSMAQMRKFQPKMKIMKERYADDREGMQKAMMKLYKEEKINPLGGCLPIVVQIPVFIALYWVLLESVEMRQAPFILWIADLSTKDPYFILPILMGATMLIQHRLNPTPLDPIQAKIMMALPIVFTFFFAFFPSGLVLYWVVNNTLSIAQQWYITRIVVGDKK